MLGADVGAARQNDGSKIVERVRLKDLVAAREPDRLDAKAKTRTGSNERQSVEGVLGRPLVVAQADTQHQRGFELRSRVPGFGIDGGLRREERAVHVADRHIAVHVIRADRTATALPPLLKAFRIRLSNGDERFA